MTRSCSVLMVAVVALWWSVGLAGAHFAMIIPSKDVVGKADKKEIGLFVQFTHPFEGGPQMQMDKPEKFGVIVGEQVTDLVPALKEKPIQGKSAWEAAFAVTKPADYIFFLAPKPYWEAAEEKFIVHYTKVIVDVMAAHEGWDKPIASIAGIPVEIVPMSRPYSMYAGNMFTGQVFRDGKPVADAEVEIEWWGKGSTKAPTDAHVTQVIKADSNGVFSYAMPKPGWWGFSAIMEGTAPMQHQGKDRKVEIGAVLWVYAHPME